MSYVGPEIIDGYLDDLLEGVESESLEYQMAVSELGNIERNLWVRKLIEIVETEDDAEYFNLIVQDFEYDGELLNEISKGIGNVHEREKLVNLYKLLFERADKKDYYQLAQSLLYNLGENRRGRREVIEIFNDVEPTKQLVNLFLSQFYIFRTANGNVSTRSLTRAGSSTRILLGSFGEKAKPFVHPISFDEANDKYIHRLKTHYSGSNEQWEIHYDQSVIDGSKSRGSKFDGYLVRHNRVLQQLENL